MVDDRFIIVHYVNGKIHRDNGPAVKYGDGSEHYYINNKIHREDGAAIENPSGYKEWWFNGGYYGCGNDFTNESWAAHLTTLKATTLKAAKRK